MPIITKRYAYIIKDSKLAARKESAEKCYNSPKGGCMFIIPKKKNIALVAHDNKKKDLMEWAQYNKGSLVQHHLFATGTTGTLLSEVLQCPVHCFNSGPFGGTNKSARLFRKEIFIY